MKQRTQPWVESPNEGKRARTLLVLQRRTNGLDDSPEEVEMSPKGPTFAKQPSLGRGKR